MSAPAAEVGGLRGALEEARHARRIAETRVGRVTAAGPEQLASHVLLLAAVPDEIRRAFRERLLSRVIAYDLEHQADLVDTLEAFLRYDGSWTRCASALHVHVNTLRYRIRRIEELTGRDLARLDDRVDFYLALELA
ncbi:PucR family transcriptional regulator [Phaeacidiphilus oryzae]|uniref:PucR family transcriptional regulator n=1 Tax=Phaeacidiphilus oryzae TaxID=348818 RepID=UPI000B1FE010